MAEQNLERLMMDVKESLEREMQLLRDHMDQRFDAVLLRLDAQAARMDRQAAWINSGMRWSTRMTEWSERSDSLLDRAAKDMAALTARVEKLERKNETAN